MGTMAWRNPIIRAVLKGTHDQECVLHKLKAQSHVLELIFPPECACVRRGGIHLESPACFAARELESLTAVATQEARDIMQARASQQHASMMNGSRTMAMLHDFADLAHRICGIAPESTYDAMMMLVLVTIVWATSYLLLSLHNTGLLRHLVVLLPAGCLVVCALMYATNMIWSFTDRILGLCNGDENYFLRTL